MYPFEIGEERDIFLKITKERNIKSYSWNIMKKENYNAGLPWHPDENRKIWYAVV